MAKTVSKCYLYSKANYPIQLIYEGQEFTLPAYASNFLIPDESKLGELPNKVSKVTIKEDE